MDTQPTNGVLEDFRVEFIKCWASLPNKTSFVVLALAWVVLFQFLGNSTLGYANTRSLFGYMDDAFTAGASSVLDAEQGYALFIPVVVAVLFWRKRRELLALDLCAWWPGLLLVILGAFLHILGYSVQQPRISVIGFFVGLYGLMGVAWGAPLLRASAFPFLLFLFCVPIGALAEPVTFKLRLLVSSLVGFIAHYILAIDVIVQGNMLVDPTGHYQYEVAAACSGIRSLIATIALAVILGFTSFQNSWKRLILILSALPLAVVGNLIRMLAIIIAAEVGGQEWGSKIHDGGPGGIYSLLPYIPAFIGLLALERYLRGRPGPSTLAQVGGLKLKQT